MERIRVKAISSDNVSCPRQMNGSNMVPNDYGITDESGTNHINIPESMREDPSHKINIFNTTSRQCNFLNDGKSRQSDGNTNWDNESEPRIDEMGNKKMYLQKSSPTEDQVKIAEELESTGLQAPENKILSEKLRTVSEALNGLMEKQSIEMPEVKQTLEIKHLSKNVQSKIRQIESQYKSSFSTEAKRTGCFNRLVYDIPLQRLPKPLADKRRYYDPETVNQVSETLDLLLKENIIDEANDPQVICNLLPVEKSLEGSSLGSKINSS